MVVYGSRGIAECLRKIFFVQKGILTKDLVSFPVSGYDLRQPSRSDSHTANASLAVRVNRYETPESIIY